MKIGRIPIKRLLKPCTHGRMKLFGGEAGHK
jgi:hypothetical protein